MRSHLAVYRAQENANVNCQFARYALHHPPPPPTQQQQQQQQQRQRQQQWSTVPTAAAAAAAITPTAAAAAVAAAACYNLRAQLHHGLYHAAAAATSQTAPPPPPPPSSQQQQLLVNQQRINECAGIPLISNAGNHLTHAQRHRLLRKSGKLWPSSTAAGHSMSQLAAHAQGQPLLQNSKHQQHAHLQHQQQQQHLHSWPSHAVSYQPMRPNNSFQLTDKSRTLRYQNSAPAVLNTQQEQQQNSNSNNNTAGQDATSTMADNCLPRIIKPRKRRKKDRKPANGVLLKMEAELQPKLLQQQHQQHQQQQHHQHQQQQQQQQQQQYGQMLQHDHSHGVCFCRDCDPLRSLWDYPMLRRSHSDASGGGGATSSSSTHSDNSCASSICSQSLPVTGTNQFDEETEHFAPITGDSSRAEIVGVIGSQRSNNAAHTATTATATTPATTLYLSDSNDSGYGDILSGMNIANDLFSSCFNHTTNATSCSSNSSNNAETLLNESINEISRKLIETCAVNELPTCEASISSQGLDGCSDDTSDNSCSASASDSGLDSAGSYSSEALVFNFEHLNLMDTHIKTSPTSTDFHDCNNNQINAAAERKQQFYNNCFDLVWRSNNNNSQVTAATPTTTTTLILGTVGKLKPAFSTIS